jgi:hypothetical protein
LTALDTNRRTGRTYRALKESVQLARAGKHVTYVVHTRVLRDYVIRMLRNHFDAKVIHRASATAVYGNGSVRVAVIATEEDEIAMLRGNDQPVRFDHAWEPFYWSRIEAYNAQECAEVMAL